MNYREKILDNYVDILKDTEYETQREQFEFIYKYIENLEEENQELKKQLEERPKEYVFIGNAQNKTRDFINQITKDNKEYKNQQKEFINYLEDEIKRINPKELNIGELNLRLNDIKFTQYLIYKEILRKYKEIIGDDK